MLDSKQIPVKESLVVWSLTGEQVKNQSCLTGQAQSYVTGLHMSWVLPLRPTSLGNHQLWEWGALSKGHGTRIRQGVTVDKQKLFVFKL